MRHYTRSAFALALLGIFCTPFTVQAAEPVYEVESTSEKPLIVIRFNQRHVMYERSLYNTISRALQVKPSAVFDVVSVAPQAKDKASQQRNNAIATQNTRKVLATLHEMGLPESRISLSDASDQLDATEVRIFVR